MRRQIAELSSMVTQKEFSLPPYPRGFHMITREVLKELGELPEKGVLHLFIQHTSAGLTINENADRTVRLDFETAFNRLVPETAFYAHGNEGPDDMPAHIKATLTGSSVSIPITDRQLNLGTWQGIILCEFRNEAESRSFVATIIE
jgi:secondary thiamine-phosphate synthase enzyme